MFVNTNMNISILIPCFNWDIYNLVIMLNNLCIEEPRLKKFEILCLEDASTRFFSNKNISQLKNTQHEILPKNIGRSKIRNLMAQKGQYEWLLFIDSDSKITNPFFIRKYVDCVEQHKNKINFKQTDLKTIYYGSTIYSDKKPNSKKILHWKYGKNIESKRKNTNFSSHHFLIQKKEFQQNNTQFDEKIKSYGYEDVFFIIMNQLKPVYIKNPAHHIGIKTTQQFIHDTESSLKNLMTYSKKKEIEERIKITKVSKILSQFQLNHIIIIFFNILRSIIVKNLYSKNPSLLLFQFYKLGFFLKESKNFDLIKKS